MLKEKVSDLIDEMFEGWIGLACDDWDELENYDLGPGDEKDYARARLQEVADDVSTFVDDDLECYTEDDELLNADKAELKDLFKARLKELGYNVK